MKELKLSEIAAAVNGRLNRAEYGGLTIRGVCIDSRKAKPGCLFVPFAGARADGHAFIGEVFEKGAACCLSERPGDFDKPVIFVESSKSAIMALAEYYRGQISPIVVGITGSAGKTTTKDLAASVLSQKYNTLKTEGNLNNELGVPLTIFRADAQTEVCVVEMGMRGFGEISALSKIVRPKIAVITNIGFSHIENLGGRAGILRAKSEILDYTDSDGKIILNGDDDLLKTVENPREILYYGDGEGFFASASDIASDGIGGVSFRLRVGGEEIYVNLPLPGRHMVQNSLAAAAVGSVLGLRLPQIKAGLEAFRPSGMRMEIFRNSAGASVVNDAYNSNPDAAMAALDVLKNAEGRKIAVLGDMLELGGFAASLHESVGEYAAKRADILYTFGDLAERLSAAARKAGGAEVRHFASKEELASELAGTLAPGDTVLVKASRGMKFEEIVERLRK